ncbi:hypothetical protein [Lentzea roselyniae]|uniref:hypothetical protein n=1 Tax=Lentzea roselyniae TaxID=531940 RepID=UPI0031F73DBA
MTTDQILDRVMPMMSTWWHRVDAWHDNLLIGTAAWPWLVVVVCADYVIARAVLGVFLFFSRWFWRRLLAIPLLLQRTAADTGDPRRLRFAVLYSFRTTSLRLDRAPTSADRLDWTVFYDEHFGLFGWENASTTIGRWSLGAHVKPPCSHRRQP